MSFTLLNFYLYSIQKKIMQNVNDIRFIEKNHGSKGNVSRHKEYNYV